MATSTADPATFTRDALKVSVIIEDGSTDATVSIGNANSSGTIVYRAVATVTAADHGTINPDAVYSHIKVAGHGAGKEVICAGGGDV